MNKARTYTYNIKNWNNQEYFKEKEGYWGGDEPFTRSFYDGLEIGVYTMLLAVGGHAVTWELI